MELVYRIDGDDRICYVNPAWASGATENGQPNFMPEHVVGKPLWDFFEDAEVKDIYVRVVERVRAGHPMSFHYRCDSPTSRRSYVMRIDRQAGEQVEFTSQLESTQERASVAWLDNALEHDTHRLICMCSWCQRLLTPHHGWLPIEAAVTTLRIMELPKLPGITHGICDDCARDMEQELSGFPRKP